MLKKLDWVHPRMEELGMLLSDPAVVQDQEKWRVLMREHSQLEPLDQAVRRYAELENAQKQAQALLEDPDMAEVAREELGEIASAQRPERGKECFDGNPRRRGRRRSGAVRRDADADVHAICRTAWMENRDA